MEIGRNLVLSSFGVLSAKPSYNEMKSLLNGLDGFLPTADQLTNHLVHQTDLEAEKLSGDFFSFSLASSIIVIIS